MSRHGWGGSATGTLHAQATQGTNLVHDHRAYLASDIWTNSFEIFEGPVDAIDDDSDLIGLWRPEAWGWIGMRDAIPELYEPVVVLTPPL